jgi:hypothetical protein
MRSFNLILSLITLLHALSPLQTLDLQHLLQKRSFLPALKDAQTIAESSKTAAATASASKQLLSLDEHSSPVHQADVLSSLHHEQKNLPPINKQHQAQHDPALLDHPHTPPSYSPKPNLEKQSTESLPPIGQHSETSHDNSLAGHIPTTPSSPPKLNLDKQSSTNDHPEITPLSHDPSPSNPPKPSLEKEPNQLSPTHEHSDIAPDHSPSSHHPSTPSTPDKPHLEGQPSGQSSKGRLSALRK